MTYVRPRRLPDGKSYTNDDDKYANAWLTIAGRFLTLLPEWTLHSCDPNFEFVKYSKIWNGETIIVDRLTISCEAIETILSNKK